MLLSVLAGYFGRGDKNNAEILAVQAQNGDKQAMEDLLVSYSPFMKKTAGQVCKRFINDHDEEFSIALSAFHEAVNGFNQEKNASFLTFAHMVIRRRVIDFIRKEAGRKEFVHDFQGLSEAEDFHSGIDTSASIQDFSEHQQAAVRREEIAEYEKLLSGYGMSFQDLVKVSPSHEDARTTAIQIAQLVTETEEYKQYLLQKKKLPVKEIEQLVQVSRKTIERNRKYIIAVALLLMSDLHYLKDYLKGRLR
ncbi:RNA polymerase sigma-I factor [Planococcus halotolerans]|uniref:RNA polymerase sigma factor SigI n=1 Tax=Planococcus halotolerans TaxID=2233542 RepID=A0A365L1X1_9BACL|nr:RNA polymerase sigma-I factor [Planococcus halotolerans]QHJ70793.1 RNA polymerase sigma-I factor [Planococcus halotolerans]RAZ79451.1 RNA polymerase sigma-I factor [Planococcus halotolerans]